MFALRGKWCCAIAHSDVLMSATQSDVMCSFLTRRSAHHKATPSSRTKCASRSACGTHRSKNEKAVQWTAFVFGCGDGIWTSWPSGYEPDELPDCSTPRYNGAGSRDRTGTRSKSHGILSPGRLPVPPFRHKCDRTSSILPIHYSTSLLFCQYPFWKKYFSRRFFAPFLLTRGKKCDIIYRLVWYIVCPVSWIYSHFVGENKLNSW